MSCVSEAGVQAGGGPRNSIAILCAQNQCLHPGSASICRRRVSCGPRSWRVQLAAKRAGVPPQKCFASDRFRNELSHLKLEFSNLEFCCKRHICISYNIYGRNQET